VIRLKNGYLATGHFSRSYDAGCVSIRRFHPPNEDKEDPPSPPPMPERSLVASVLNTNNLTTANEEKKSAYFSLELPVVYSRFGDLYPVADFDFYDR